MLNEEKIRELGPAVHTQEHRARSVSAVQSCRPLSKDLVGLHQRCVWLLQLTGSVAELPEAVK